MAKPTVTNCKGNTAKYLNQPKIGKVQSFWHQKYCSIMVY